MFVEENNLESEGLDFNMSFLNEQDEETTQESETESQYDEDVTILDEEGSDEKLDEVEEELELEEEVEEEYEEEEYDDVSYTPFVEPLIEEGILYIDPEKEYDDSPEGFAEILEDTVNYRFQEVLASLPEDAQRVIEVIQAGESLESALEVFNSFDYSQIDLEDVDTQRELTKDYLLEKFPKWSEERLNKELQNREDLDELKELAEEAQGYFVEKTEAQKEEYYEQVQARQQAAIEAQEQEINSYVQMIDEAEGFNGIRFTSNKQREEFKQYTLAKGEDGLTQYERDTKAKENQLALAWTVFNKGATMESIQRQAVTKATVAQKKILARLGQQDKNAKSGKAYADRQARPKGDMFIPPIDWIQ
jgi:hypothetical protein